MAEEQNVFDTVNYLLCLSMSNKAKIAFSLRSGLRHHISRRVNYYQQVLIDLGNTYLDVKV